MKNLFSNVLRGRRQAMTLHPYVTIKTDTGDAKWLKRQAQGGQVLSVWDDSERPYRVFWCCMGLAGARQTLCQQKSLTTYTNISDLVTRNKPGGSYDSVFVLSGPNGLPGFWVATNSVTGTNATDLVYSGYAGKSWLLLPGREWSGANEF
jgi:hypothetical protein